MKSFQFYHYLFLHSLHGYTEEKADGIISQTWSNASNISAYTSNYECIRTSIHFHHGKKKLPLAFPTLFSPFPHL